MLQCSYLNDWDASMLKTINVAITKYRLHWSLAVAGFALIWGLLTIPYGLRGLGLVDEWFVYWSFTTSNSWLTIIDANRLGQLIPYYLSYLLTPNSFVGLNIVFTLTMFVKMILLFAVFKYLLHPHKGLAFVAAVLAVIYPADVGLFQLRYLGYHWVIWTYLFALYMFLRWGSRPRLIYLLLMMVAQLECLLIYEVAFPLMLATPLLLIWLRPRFKQNIRTAALLWWITPCLVLVGTLIFLFSGRAAYQSSVLARASTDLGWNLFVIAVNVVRMYLQHFALSWASALTTPLNLQQYVLAGLIGVCTGGVAYLQTADTRITLRLRRWVLVGFGVMFLAFLPFFPLEYHRLLSERVFLLSSLGAGLALVMWLYRVVRSFKRRRILFAALTTVVTAVAACWAFQQHNRNQFYSSIEGSILSSIVSTMPDWKTDQVLVVLIDRTSQLATNGEILFGGNDSSFVFNNSLQFIYHSPDVAGVLCFPETLTWRVERERCEFGAESFVVYGLNEQRLVYPYSQVVVFEYTGDTTLLSPDMLRLDGVTNPDYAPDQVIDFSADLPARIAALELR
jgi:hypothetical protein